MSKPDAKRLNKKRLKRKKKKMKLNTSFLDFGKMQDQISTLQDLDKKRKEQRRRK